MKRPDELTLGSLFDGSGGFPLAGILAGIRPVWASEIEPFPIRVTTKRLPEMRHCGDVTSLDGASLEPVDIITFGSPCQNLSIAGRREGLGGDRSSLFFEAVRIVKEMRRQTNGRSPEFVVWENVPGAFSSNGGEDFRIVLQSLCGVKGRKISVPGPPGGKWKPAGEIVADGFSIAWRVLDAQYWGVPQRRKRIFLVADFGGCRAGKILFESEGLSGYSAEGFRAWQSAAGKPADRAGTTGCVCINDQGGPWLSLSQDVAPALLSEAHGHGPSVFENHLKDVRYNGPLKSAPAVCARYGTGGNNQPLVVEEEKPVTLKIRSGCEGGGKGALLQEDLSATLACGNDQTLFVPKRRGNPTSAREDMPVVAFHVNQRNELIDLKNKSGALMASRSDQMQTFVIQEPMEDRNTSAGHTAYGIDRAAYHQGANAKYGFAVEEELQPTLVANGPGAVAQPQDETGRSLRGTSNADAGHPEYTVRRLTPVECARLQGFPDWWTAGLETEEPSEEEIQWWSDVFETHRKATGGSSKPKTRKQIAKWLKNPFSDAAAYKMWGNGICLPVTYFVLSGIAYFAEKPV